MNSRTTKHLKGKNVSTGNVSKHTSNSATKISRIKKPSPELLEMLKRANEVKSAAEVMGIIEADQRREDMEGWNKVGNRSAEQLLQDSIAQQMRQFQLREKAARLFDQVRFRDILLEIIEVAKRGEINYLRKCSQCDKLFFAGRKDQQGCSPACLNKIRKERWRKHYTEAKNDERRGYLKKRAKTAPKH